MFSKPFEFNSGLFADVLIRFQTTVATAPEAPERTVPGAPERTVPEAPESTEADDQATEANESTEATAAEVETGTTFFAHRFILAHNSPVLKTLLQRTEKEVKKRRRQEVESMPSMKKPATLQAVESLPQTYSSSVEPELRTLDVLVEEDEVAAAEVLLRCMYTGNFEEEVERGLSVSCKDVSSSEQQRPSKVKLLVKLYCLADRFEVGSIISACTAAMSEICKEDFEELESINAIFSLSNSAPALWDHAPIQALSGRCMEQLVANCNADILICLYSNIGINLISELVFPAMHALACSSKLRLTSENDMVAMLDCWVRHNNPGMQQIVQLSHAVRVKLLTPTYLLHLKTIAPWLQADQEQLMDILVLANSRSSAQGTPGSYSCKGWRVPMHCDFKVTSGMRAGWSVETLNIDTAPVTTGEPWLCNRYIKIPVKDLIREPAEDLDLDFTISDVL